MAAVEKPIEFELELDDLVQADKSLADDAMEIVEGDAKAVNASLDQAEAILDDIADAVKVSDKLIEVQLIAKEEMANDAINVNTSKLFELTIKELYGRVGYEAEANMPATESFANPVKSAQALQIAIEGIGDALGSIWKSMVTGLRKVMGVIDGMWNKLLKTQGNTLRRLDRVRADVMRKTLAFSDEGTVTNKGLAKRLQIHGQVPEDIPAELRKTLDNFEIANGFTSKMCDYYFNGFFSDLKNLFTNKLSELKFQFPDVSGLPPANAAEIDKTAWFGKTSMSAIDGIDFKSTGEMMGGRYMVMGVPKKSLDKKAMIGTMAKYPQHVGINFFEAPKTALASADIKAFNSQQTNDALNSMKLMLNAFPKIHRGFMNYTSRTQAQDIERFWLSIANVASIFNAERRLEIKYAQHVNMIVGYDLRHQTRFLNYVLNLTNAVLDLIVASGKKSKATAADQA